MDVLLDQLSRTVVAAGSLEELTRPLLDLLERVTGLESTYLTQIDEEAGLQSILYARNTGAMVIPEGLSVPWDDTLCKRALEEGRTSCEDASIDWADSDAARALGIRTYVTTPLWFEDGTLYGTLCAASSRVAPLTDDGQQILALFGRLILQYVQRERLVDDLREANRLLEHRSNTDALTGLANRRAILDELRHLFSLARRVGRSVLVAFIDLDGFKQINDRHGHEAGDVFLVEIGQRLASGLRSADRIGRLGGDEFVVIGLGPMLDEDAQAIIQSWRSRIGALSIGQFDLGETRLDYAGASMGVICADPNALSPESALSEADAAMYDDKRHRRESTLGSLSA